MVSSKYASRLDSKHFIISAFAKLHGSSRVNSKAILVRYSPDLFYLMIVLVSMPSFHWSIMVYSIANSSKKSCFRCLYFWLRGQDISDVWSTFWWCFHSEASVHEQFLRSIYRTMVKRMVWSTLWSTFLICKPLVIVVSCHFFIKDSSLPMLVWRRLSGWACDRSVCLPLPFWYKRYQRGCFSVRSRTTDLH